MKLTVPSGSLELAKRKLKNVTKMLEPWSENGQIRPTSTNVETYYLPNGGVTTALLEGMTSFNL
jgi:hypothetical protein